MTDNTCASPTLPVEILDLIVKDVGEDADFKTLRSLRLVCKSVNELAGPIVFRKLTIRMKKSTMAWIQNQLPALAESGSNSPSANARWTKELHIFDLTPMAPIVRSNPHALPGDFLDEEEEKIIRTVQSTYLAQAIQSLNNVESVYFAISPQEPHADVFWALAKLPNLQQLRLTLSRSLDVNEQLPISVFPSKLRALEVGHMATHPSVLAVVGAWIGKSPCLEELRLGPVTWGFLPVDPTSDRAVPTPRTRFPPAEIERIFEDTVDRVPKLKKLVVDDPGLMFRSTSVPHLRNLTHLSIVGDHEGLPSFWDALSRAGVCLRHLTANLSPGLAVLNYLTSYRGLEELHLTAAAVEVAADIPRKCFHEVLPRHQHSLRHLSFSSMQFESWSITEEYLEGVLKCTSLQTLALYMVIGLYASSSVDLSILLMRIAEHLPCLQSLRVQPQHRKLLFRRPSTFLTPMTKETMRLFLSSICEADLDGLSSSLQPSFLVEIVWQHNVGHSVLAFNSSRRRFEPITTINLADRHLGTEGE